MLPEQDWLQQAKRLSIGMRTRIRHRDEGRMNLTIGNEPDRWWAYCNRCKEGGVIMKAHVLLNMPVVREESLRMPTDLMPLHRSQYNAWCLHFLFRKGMDPEMLPPVYFSESARRIMIEAPHGGGWHGRDLTEKSGAKWMNYGQAKFVGQPTDICIVTEDLFSMFKVRYAMRYFRVPVSVCCTLGAGLHDAAVLALKSCKTIVWAYDGDKAGDDGHAQGVRRMRPFGQSHMRARPPEGLDPKDLHLEKVRILMEEALHAV